MCGIEYKNCDCFFDYSNFEDDLILYRYLYFNKDYRKNFDSNLKKRFANTSNFSKHDVNRFILFLLKDVYPYECVGDWEKFIETSLPEKEDFYSHLDMKNITNVDYTQAKTVCKDCKTTNLDNYDLYAQSDIVLPADVFNNFQNICLEV